MVRSAVHNSFLNTLTLRTPYPCVPAAFQQRELRSHAFPLEMTSGLSSGGDDGTQWQSSVAGDWRRLDHIIACGWTSLAELMHVIDCRLTEHVMRSTNGSSLSETSSRYIFLTISAVSDYINDTCQRRLCALLYSTHFGRHWRSISNVYLDLGSA